MPEHIGRYRVVRSIACGGMSEVYEVVEPASGERLALKLLTYPGPVLPRFNREYEAMTRLNHVGIVRVFEYGFHNDKPWISMELLDGVPLQKAAKDMGRPGTPDRTREVLRYGTMLADSLAYVHQRGLVHRDIKSSNVVILPDGRVKLVDFGAVHLIDPMERLTADGEFLGTFAYAAPEQISGGEVDARSDLYSFGVLLYRLLTGRRPLDDDDPHMLARKHVHSKPPNPRDLVPAIPEEVEDVVLKLLEKKPDDRYQTADAVSKALRRLRGGATDVGHREFTVRTSRPLQRYTETRAVELALETEDPGGIVAVVGADGSGRLKFVQAVSQDAARWPLQVYTCTMARRRGIQSFAAMMSKIGESLDPKSYPEAMAATARLRKATDGGRLSDPDFRQQLIRGCYTIAQCRAAATSHAVLIVLQDIHRADPVVLKVVASMAASAKKSSISLRFLVSSDIELADDESEIRSHLKDPTIVMLEPLAVRDVSHAVAGMLHRRPPSLRLSQLIHDASGGQPDYIEAVVRALLDGGVLQVQGNEGNRIDWVEGDAPSIPRTALRQVQHSIDQLAVDDRRILETLAVAGEPLKLVLLGGALGRSELELGVSLDHLERRGWVCRVESLGSTRAILSRPLAKHVLLEGISPLRKRYLANFLASGLIGATPTPERIRLLIADNRLTEAAERAIPCARRYMEVGEPILAADVTAQVLPLLGKTDILADDEAELHLLHANAMLMVRPTDPSIVRSLDRVEELGFHPNRAARSDLARATLHWVIGHYPKFHKTLLTAWERGPENVAPRVSASIAYQLGYGCIWSGKPRSAGEWFECSRQIANEANDPLAIGYALLGRGTLLYSWGDMVNAERDAKQAMETFQRIGDQPGHWRALSLWTRVLRLQGRISEALAILYQRIPEARKSQASSLHVQLLLNAAQCEMVLFRLGRAQECVDELEAATQRGDHLHLRLQAMLVQGEIALASGHLSEAAGLLQQAQRRATTASLIVPAEQARARLAETLWRLGDHTEAREMFRGAILGLIGTGDITAQAEACVWCARSLARNYQPSGIFNPVRGFLDQQPVPVLQLEETIAKAIWSESHGEEEVAKELWRSAAKTLNQLADRLNDTDQAALRVHPWARQIRMGVEV
jgi:tetratricopeptide (TPR) repeat protein